LTITEEKLLRWYLRCRCQQCNMGAWRGGQGGAYFEPLAFAFAAATNASTAACALGGFELFVQGRWCQSGLRRRALLPASSLEYEGIYAGRLAHHELTCSCPIWGLVAL
jgi:hypothetical protein